MAPGANGRNVQGLERPWPCVVSEDSVQRATGRPRASWLQELDRYGRDLDHAARARRLAQEHPDLPGWWVQSLVVDFERERGLREVGQTGQGYQVSCSRTLPVPVQESWKRLLGAPLFSGVAWQTGAVGQAGGARIEVRRLDARVLRLSWDDGSRSTVEASMQERGDRSTVTIRHHGLPDAAAREAARARWRALLDSLV